MVQPKEGGGGFFEEFSPLFTTTHRNTQRKGESLQENREKKEEGDVREGWTWGVLHIYRNFDGLGLLKNLSMDEETTPS
jgi:hypothetical protein